MANFVPPHVGHIEGGGCSSEECDEGRKEPSAKQVAMG